MFIRRVAALLLLWWVGSSAFFIYIFWYSQRYRSVFISLCHPPQLLTPVKINTQRCDQRNYINKITPNLSLAAFVAFPSSHRRICVTSERKRRRKKQIQFHLINFPPSRGVTRKKNANFYQINDSTVVSCVMRRRQLRYVCLLPFFLMDAQDYVWRISAHLGAPIKLVGGPSKGFAASNLFKEKLSFHGFVHCFTPIWILLFTRSTRSSMKEGD